MKKRKRERTRGEKKERKGESANETELKREILSCYVDLLPSRHTVMLIYKERRQTESSDVT